MWWSRRVALFGFPIALGVACCALALTPAFSEAATVTGVPAALPSCAAAEAGFDSRQNAQVTTFGDGGKLYTYEQQGHKIVLPQPPADFAPLKASDAELERYAFPPRPSPDQAERLKRWEALMSDYTGTAPPVTCTGSPPSTGIKGPVYPVEESRNWSGFVTSDFGNKKHWNAAEADFFQVNGAAYTSCKSNAILASWVGLGGKNYTGGNRGLIQAGTFAYTNGATQVWYAWLAGSFVELAYFPEMYVNPGDYVGFLVEYNSATETATYVTYDQNTGIFRSVVMPGLPPQFYDGSSGDFIAERPGSGAETFYPLLNFGSTSFYNAEVRNSSSGSWVWLGEPNHQEIQMKPGKSLLAAPFSLTSVNGFTDYYYGCQ